MRHKHHHHNYHHQTTRTTNKQRRRRNFILGISHYIRLSQSASASECAYAECIRRENDQAPSRVHCAPRHAQRVHDCRLRDQAEQEERRRLRIQVRWRWRSAIVVILVKTKDTIPGNLTHTNALKFFKETSHTRIVLSSVMLAIILIPIDSSDSTLSSFPFIS